MMCSKIGSKRGVGSSRVKRICLFVILMGLIPSLSFSNPLDEVGHYGENIGAVAVDGTRGVFNEGSKIRVMDLTNPAAPVYKGAVDIGVIPCYLFLHGNIAYSGSQFGTVHVIDISNPSNPSILGSVQNLTYPESIWGRSQDDYIYVGCSDNSIAVINVSNKTSPALVRKLTANINSCIYSISGDGQYLYACSGYFTATKMYIWSLSNPSSPIYQGSCTMSESSEWMGNGVAINGNTAYVATKGGTYIVNITNHQSPQVVMKMSSSVDRLSISQGILHSSSWNTLRLYSLSTPLNPEYLYSYSYPGNDVAGQIVAQGNYDYSGRQQTLYVTNTGINPPVVSNSRSMTPSIGSARGIARSGNTLFLGKGFGLIALDITNRNNPQLLQAVTNNNEFEYRMIANGNTLYSVSGSYLEVWNVSNPSNMQLLDEFTVNGYSTQIAIGGTYLCACSEGTLSLYKIGSSGLLTPKCTMQTSGNSESVALQDTALYVVGKDGKLRCYDISNDTTLTLRSTITLDPSRRTDQPGLIRSYGNNLHALLPGSGYFLINIADRLHPVLINSLRDTAIDSTDIAVDGNKVYLSVGGSYWNGATGGGRNAIRVLDLSSLPQINLVNSRNAVDYTFECLPFDGYLYVAENAGCLRIYSAYPKTNLPPSQPTGHAVLAYSISTPSTDPEGGNVSYTYRWTSDHGDVVVHGPTTATQDVLTEWNLVQTGEIWTVTVTPSDGSQNGVLATAMVKVLDAKNGVAQWMLYK